MKINRKIKVAHICFSDSRGGASIAANRLNIALNKKGLISKLFVIDKRKSNSTKLNNSILEKLFYFFVDWLKYFLGGQYMENLRLFTHLIFLAPMLEKNL